MKQSELIARIVAEWDRWLQNQPGGRSRPAARETLKFFCELQDSRSPLLEFRSGGRDKWHVIHGWLLSEGRVSQVITPARSPRRPGAERSRPPGAQASKQRGKRST